VIAALLATLALAEDLPAQWEDAVVDRSPRQATVSLSEGAAFGRTLFSNTRLQVGLTPYSRPRGGVGIVLTAQGNVVAVPSEDRANAGIGGLGFALHGWFSPKKNARTTHDLAFGLQTVGPSAAYLVRYDDVVSGPTLAYSGYYDAGDTLDIAFSLGGGLGVPPDNFLALLVNGNTTAYWSPVDDRWAIALGMDASIKTAAFTAGARWRASDTVELGATWVVPWYTVAALRGLPAWPVVEATARF
jgi:hypothetical protein